MCFGQDDDLMVATATSSLSDTCEAVKELAGKLGTGRDRPADFVALHYGSARPVAELNVHAIEAFGGGALHGASSCLGVMTEENVLTENGDAIGAFAIWDSDGSFGSAMVVMNNDPRSAGAKAIRSALVRAGRAGEVPDLVWLTATPGYEEAVLEGIKDVIGRSALIVGGSAADNAVAGGWSVFSSEGMADAAVVVSVLFPSTPFGSAFESGYAPTRAGGIVTHAEGRRLLEIDGRPAAEVYANWSGGKIEVPTTGSRSILSEATMSPIGRRRTDIAGIPIHLLAHPAVIHADGGIDLFSEVDVGTEIYLMEGAEANLVQRAGHVALKSRGKLGDAPAAGALMVYCGGCMLAIREHMNEVATSVAENLQGAPFLGVFSFGEQGEMLGDGSEHGNLMISCTTFGRTRAPEPRRFL
jgi:hypothetical protein